MTSEIQPPNRPPTIGGLNAEQVERLLAIQEKELALSVQEQESSDRFAMASIEFDARERDAERHFILKLVTGQRILIGSISLIFLVFTGIVLAMGKDAIAIEILKAAGFFFAGGSVGWSIHRGGSSKRQTRD